MAQPQHPIEGVFIPVQPDYEGVFDSVAYEAAEHEKYLRKQKAREASARIAQQARSRTPEEQAAENERVKQRMADVAAEQEREEQEARAQASAVYREAMIENATRPHYEFQMHKWLAANPTFNEYYFQNTVWPHLRVSLYDDSFLQERAKRKAQVAERSRLEGLEI